VTPLCHVHVVPKGLRRSYRVKMVTLIRIARFAVLLILAATAVSLVMAMFRPEIGGVEKVVLAALLATCFAMGVGVTYAAAHLRQRFALSRVVVRPQR
jgi:hypothetical protein